MAGRGAPRRSAPQRRSERVSVDIDDDEAKLLMQEIPHSSRQGARQSSRLRARQAIEVQCSSARQSSRQAARQACMQSPYDLSSDESSGSDTQYLPPSIANRSSRVKIRPRRRASRRGRSSEHTEKFTIVDPEDVVESTQNQEKDPPDEPMEVDVPAAEENMDGQGTKSTERPDNMENDEMCPPEETPTDKCGKGGKSEGGEEVEEFENQEICPEEGAAKREDVDEEENREVLPLPSLDSSNDSFIGAADIVSSTNVAGTDVQRDEQAKGSDSPVENQENPAAMDPAENEQLEPDSTSVVENVENCSLLAPIPRRPTSDDESENQEILDVLEGKIPSSSLIRSKEQEESYTGPTNDIENDENIASEETVLKLLEATAKALEDSAHKQHKEECEMENREDGACDSILSSLIPGNDENITLSEVQAVENIQQPRPSDSQSAPDEVENKERLDDEEDQKKEKVDQNDGCKNRTGERDRRDGDDDNNGSSGSGNAGNQPAAQDATSGNKETPPDEKNVEQGSGSQQSKQNNIANILECGEIQVTIITENVFINIRDRLPKSAVTSATSIGDVSICHCVFPTDKSVENRKRKLELKTSENSKLLKIATIQPVRIIEKLLRSEEVKKQQISRNLEFHQDSQIKSTILDDYNYDLNHFHFHGYLKIIIPF